jgi:hypothetical protein
MEKKVCHTPGIFYNIFFWEFFLERDISMIFSSVRLKIHPQFQASWQHRLFTLDMGSFN